MNTHMNDHAWRQLLNLTYLVETECLNIKKEKVYFLKKDFNATYHHEKNIRLNLPWIAGIDGDPVQSYQMMDRVFDLLNTPVGELF